MAIGDAAPPPPQLSSAAPPVLHFFHPHDLHIVSLSDPGTLTCAACKLRSPGVMYTCLPCTFALHQSCAQLPRHVTHPAHAGCVLSLLQTASYPGGIFSCDGCKRPGDGWVYNCARCEYDLHVTCACRPLRIRVPCHGSCELHLTFTNPYPISGSAAAGFSCDVCRKFGTRQWVYHCAACEFDVHLDCAVHAVAAAPSSSSQPALQHCHSLPGTVAEGARPVHVARSSGMDVVWNSSSSPAVSPLMNSVKVTIRPNRIIHQFQGNDQQNPERMEAEKIGGGSG